MPSLTAGHQVLHGWLLCHGRLLCCGLTAQIWLSPGTQLCLCSESDLGVVLLYNSLNHHQGAEVEVNFTKSLC